MNMNRAISAAFAVAALSTYQAWAVDVPVAPGALQQGTQKAASPIENPPLPAAGVAQRDAQNAPALNQAPAVPRAGVNVTVPGAAQITVGQPTVASNQVVDNRPDRWRYKFENNRWWYYTPENRWMSYSDQYGWTYPESAGGYTTAYAAPVAPPAVEYAAPTTTYYSYPSYGYYYNGYPRSYYYGRPGVYVGGPWGGVRVGRRWW